MDAPRLARRPAPVGSRGNRRDSAHGYAPAVVTSTARLKARLGESPLFGPLAPERLDALAAGASIRRIERGETLWEAGDQPDAVAFVLAGRLDLVDDVARRPLRLRSVHVGEVVGISGVARVPSSAAATAGTDVEVAIFRGVDVRAVLRRDPDFALRAIAHLGRLVAEVSRERREALLEDLDARLRRWLAAEARRGSEIRRTHEHIAESLGVTRPRVSEALKRLERAGIVRRRRGRMLYVAPARTPPGP